MGFWFFAVRTWDELWVMCRKPFYAHHTLPIDHRDYPNLEPTSTLHTSIYKQSVTVEMRKRYVLRASTVGIESVNKSRLPNLETAQLRHGTKTHRHPMPLTHTRARAISPKAPKALLGLF